MTSKELIRDTFFIDDSDFQGILDSKIRMTQATIKSDSSAVFLKFTNLEDEYLENYFTNFERLAKITHPNILEHKHIYKLDKSDFNFSVLEVLEYSNQGPLSSFLKAPRKFSEIVDLFTQTLKGLEFLHANGVLHRDIKATNILVHQTQYGTFSKISDIEFWRDPHNVAPKTTPEYLAPEVTSYTSYNEQSEVWAFGLMLYELFTGEFPFGSRLRGDTIEKIRDNSRHEQPSQIDKIPPPFRTLVAKSLVKDPTKRLKTVSQMLDLLNPPTTLVQFFKSKFSNVNK